MSWFTAHNKSILSNNGIHDDFVWGKVTSIYDIDDIQIVEYETRDSNELKYHPYVSGSDTGLRCDSLDEAVLTALGFKYDGRNSQFAYFAYRMLGIKGSEE